MPKEISAHQHHDFMIVGQGLAGSLLAWSLLQAGAEVCIVSDRQLSASRVAAGLINPVTGQRFVLADRTPDMLTWAKNFYQNIETTLSIKCFHVHPMIRLFNNNKEQSNCNKRLLQPAYRPYLHPCHIPDALNAEYSGILQRETAWLDTNVLLDALHEYFQKHATVVFADVDVQAVQQKKDTLHWQGLSTSKIIYSQGYKMLENPLFSWLPLQPSHGEIITCSTTEEISPEIINKGKWLLPTSTHSCRIGATYDPDIKTPTKHEKSKQNLLQFAQALFTEKHTFTCTNHQAGIRPTTKDKQPFIGFHPLHPNICIFNGFGSRGSLLIPWYAREFSNTLLQDYPIPMEADIMRFTSLCV